MPIMLRCLTYHTQLNHSVRSNCPFSLEFEAYRGQRIQTITRCPLKLDEEQLNNICHSLLDQFSCAPFLELH